MPTASDNRNTWSARKEGSRGPLLPDFYIPKKPVEKRSKTGCSEGARDNETDLRGASGQRKRLRRKKKKKNNLLSFFALNVCKDINSGVY